MNKAPEKKAEQTTEDQQKVERARRLLRMKSNVKAGWCGQPR